MKRIFNCLLIIMSIANCSLRAQTAAALVKASGQALIDSLLRELPGQKEDSNKVKLLNRMSGASYSFNPEDGIKYGKQSLALAQKMGWTLGIAESEYQLATNYCIKSDYDSAIELYFGALKIYEKLGSVSGQAATQSNIGHIYYAQCNYPKALEYEQSALSLQEGTGEMSHLATNLLNIGNIYGDEKNFPKALDYYSRALKSFEEINNKEGIGTALGNIGNVYEQQKNYAQALEFDLKALKLYQERGIKDGIATTLSNIGNIYMLRGDYNQSLAYSFMSLQLNTELGIKDGIAINYGNIGAAYLHIVKDSTKAVRADSLVPGSKSLCLAKAMQYLSSGIAMCKEIGYPDGIIDFSEALSNAYQLTGNYKAALEAYIQYSVTKDTVYSAATKVKITNLETERELSLKEKQIEIERLAIAKKRNERWFFIAGIGLLLCVIVIVWRNYYLQKNSNKLLAKEKQRSDDLLLNILPQEVADELKEHGSAAARHFDNVTVLFTDFVNFTISSERLSPQALIDELHTCFKAFDNITAKYKIEKIKTIGDAYLAVCGLPLPDPKHAGNVVQAALEINQFMQDRLKKLGNDTFEIRIGIHSGSVVAGIVGVKKFAYDIWGDTVNTAARLEQNSDTGKINISQTTYELVKDQFHCTYRGEIEAKGKGMMKMYYVDQGNL